MPPEVRYDRHMASFGYELLAALEQLVEQFDDGEGGGASQHMATITPEYRAELEALIARGRD